MKWHGKHSSDISTRTIPGFIEMLSQFSRECSLCPMMLISFRPLDKRRKRCQNEDDEESGFAASLFLQLLQRRFYFFFLPAAPTLALAVPRTIFFLFFNSLICFLPVFFLSMTPCRANLYLGSYFFVLTVIACFSAILFPEN